MQGNLIGNEGALTLAEILPCTNLSFIGFGGNPADNTTLVLAAQQKALRKVCDDQRCHANIPTSEACQVNTVDNLTRIDELPWKIADFLGGFSASSISSLLPTLALTGDSSSSQVLSATAAAGTLILGLTLSALLYKNSTWFHGIVNASCHLLQCGWNSGKAITTKTVSLLHCRSTVFSRASTVTRQRSLPFVVETNRVSQNLA